LEETMTSNAQIILDMLQELAACRKRIEKLREGISDDGLSLDVCRAYDGFITVAEALADCYMVAYKEDE
jgi:hypothetical protein